MRLHGITFRLSLAVFLSISVITIAGFFYGYGVVKKLLLVRIEESAKQLTGRTANQVELVINRTEKVAENMADVLSLEDLTGTQIENLVYELILNNTEVYGSAVAFEPFAFSAAHENYCPYFFRNPEDPDGISSKFLHPPEYDYRDWDWFKRPMQQLRPSWSEPYFDEGGGEIQMTTYSVPFFRANSAGERIFSGVVTADLSLEWLQELVGSLRIAHSGYAFIIDQKGNLITYPEPAKPRAKRTPVKISSLLEADPVVEKILRRMTQGESGFVECADPLRKTRSGWIAFGPIHATEWSIGVIFPEEEIFSDIASLQHRVAEVFVVGSFVLLVVIFLVARSITRPILALAEASREIASGRLGTPVPQLRTKDEVAMLAQVLEGMRLELQDYIRNLAETAAAKERIQRELQIAHDIQMSMLPKLFPPFPERPEFALHALIQPAKQVGGDFYDYGLLPDNKLFLCIGDVSDKGVPAALFMAVTTTLIKLSSRERIAPSLVLERINRQLALDNATCMFATVFCGLLDYKTGELAYSSGGHNPPMILTQEGKVSLLPRTNGMAVALEETASFDTKITYLREGDTLLMYTDGITEAMNATDELYGEKRLLAFLEKHPGLEPEQLIQACLLDLADHVQEAPQSDDLTLVALRLRSM